MKKKILEKLQSTDGFVSGQELCELLGVSRTAVWKNIQALKNDGYVIELSLIHISEPTRPY